MESSFDEHQLSPPAKKSQFWSGVFALNLTSYTQRPPTRTLSNVDEALCQQWAKIFVCPIGVVYKSSGTDIRLINDHAYPGGASVNDLPIKRCCCLFGIILLLIPSGVCIIYATSQERFAIFQFMKITSTCLASYWIIISSILSTHPEPLIQNSESLTKVRDGHTCAEVNTASRCFETNLALHQAMATVQVKR
ncbi:Hypothetical protein PHPALM_8535 [Phytophthora palmivora]|uniref:Uncharacterized protein n=1 Tax=Phytophthora palmivora TaxID=4796 RepID=A0A2P4Y9L3_9STRA|nr:Hypothetical protein PHPALM_8535 [Phytophthora palmivora]